MQLANKVKHNGAVKTERIPFAARRCRLSTNCPAVRTSYLSADNNTHCLHAHTSITAPGFIAFAATGTSTSYPSPLQHQRFQHHTYRLCSTRDFNIIPTACAASEISTSYPSPLKHQRFQHHIHRLCSIRDFNIVHIAFATSEISTSYTSPLQHQRFQNHTPGAVMLVLACRQ